MYIVFFITLVLGGGFFLFCLKQEVVELEQKHHKIERAIIESKEAIHVLNAEWSYLNDPKRLQMLAQRYLPEWGGIKPTQIIVKRPAKIFKDPELIKVDVNSVTPQKIIAKESLSKEKVSQQKVKEKLIVEPKEVVAPKNKVETLSDLMPLKAAAKQKQEVSLDQFIVEDRKMSHKRQREKT